MLQHSEKKQTQLIKKCRCFRRKKKGYTAYNYPKNRKITAILEGVSENSNNQRKK